MKLIKPFKIFESEEENLHDEMFPKNCENGVCKVGDKTDNGLTIIDVISDGTDYTEYVAKDEEGLFYLLDSDCEILGDRGFDTLDELGEEFGINFEFDGEEKEINFMKESNESNLPEVKVKHLIEYLSKLDPEMEVYLDHDGWMAKPGQDPMEVVENRGIFSPYESKGQGKTILYINN